MRLSPLLLFREYQHEYSQQSISKSVCRSMADVLKWKGLVIFQNSFATVSHPDDTAKKAPPMLWYDGMIIESMDVFTQVVTALLAQLDWTHSPGPEVVHHDILKFLSPIISNSLALFLIFLYSRVFFLRTRASPSSFSFTKKCRSKGWVIAALLISPA